MTETGPRKGLWNLMGQKQPTDSSAPSPPVSDAAATSNDPAASESSGTPSAASAASAQPLSLDERLPDVKPRGRGLWQLMQSATPEAPEKSVIPDAAAAEPPATTASPADMRSAFEAPVKGADRRLRQMAAPEVEIVEDAAGTLDDPVELEAVEEAVEVQEPVKLAVAPALNPHPPIARIPLDLAITVAAPATPPSDIKTGTSRTALWSTLLGALSLPISLVAIYPAIWTRIPSSVVGFAALMLGFLSLNEIQRSKGRRRGTVLAWLGMAMGAYGMFAGPLIYAPLDLYAQWCDRATTANLRQISLATDAYYQQHQTYPAGGVFHDIKKGEREGLHGWMTLLLPYLPDGAPLSKQIDMSKPYSNPANLPAMSQPVPTFQSADGDPSLIQGKYAPAHFAGLGGILRVSDGSMAHVGLFEANSDITREGILDGASNTMLAGEIATKIPAWGEPRNWRQVGRGLNRDPEGFGNARHSGALFLMADGSVRFLPNNTDLKVLQALSTRDGEEKP